MNIYVQSRGDAPDDDYCWQPEVPYTLKKHRINELIQSESPSVILARFDGNLLLLVTGLESSERKDFQGRTIRNSVAWVGEDTESNEIKLRAIAACALRDELRENLRAEIDHAITFGGDCGFQVNFDSLTHLAIEEVINVYNFPANLDKKLGKNSKQQRDELAYELEQHILPSENAPLLVVTGIKSESTLIQAGVWRGLSSLVQAGGWKDPYKKSYTSAQTTTNSYQKNQKNNNLVLLILLLVGIAIAILLLLLIAEANLQSQPELKPTSQYISYRLNKSAILSMNY
ncbi:hypothetical protein IQ230_19645 [Gloeocapsopsis crepidinum LEGE 06123]|uniref:Uncharacterized protein n=1 Tax=Gloeocapsopsis crepidinum LEGE 06123 TaxID=588587 RepID=A0ABR9UW53_9CHRO|nr:hypothetical protein [Gloeocapsopsis crepidinum]MBE9192522.1 hypothetical protein [Gloeocapsopsis crepidinum LEGE 06123]